MDTVTNDNTAKKKVSLKGIWQVLKDAFGGFSDDKITKLSGSLAYSTVFSMGPLLVVMMSICGIFFKREAIEGKVYAVLEEFVGSNTAAQLQDIIRHAAVSNKSTIALIIGIITLIIGATSIFAEIQDSINGIWGIKPKPKSGLMQMLRNRFLSFSVIVGLGFLLLVSLAVSGIIEAISKGLQAQFPDVAIVVFYIINLLLTFGISALIFGVIFKVLPDAKIKWKDIKWGAIITAFLFLLGKFVISIYISKAAVGSTYGAAGSLVVLLVWIYYSSIILYLGAEFTKSFAVKYGEPIYPNDYAVTTKQIEIELGSQTIQQKENQQIIAKEK